MTLSSRRSIVILAAFCALLDLTRAQGPRLLNFSLRAQGGGSETLIVGFTLGPGPSKSVLVRAVGPGLSLFGVSGALADPRLELYDSAGAKIAENDNFTATEAAMFSSVGAFALSGGAKDAAIITTLSPGSYTARVSGNGGASGVALVEVYEMTGGLSRLTNLSARAQVGTGGNILIPGLTIAPGAGTWRFLMRAVGPALSAAGVANPLADPKLELYAGETKIAENDNWGAPVGLTAASGPALTELFAQNGAFALAAESKDAALLVNLGAGSYTLQVRGADGGSGEALVEIYEVATESPVSVEAFTVSRERVRGRYFYRPQLRLAETSGKSAVVITSLTFRLEGLGGSSSVPPWTMSKPINAGSARDLINPDVYGDYEFEIDSDLDATSVSVVATFLNDRNRADSVSAIALVPR